MASDLPATQRPRPGRSVPNIRTELISTRFLGVLAAPSRTGAARGVNTHAVRRRRRHRVRRSVVLFDMIRSIRFLRFGAGDAGNAWERRFDIEPARLED